MWSFRLGGNDTDKSVHGKEAAAAIERAQASLNEVRARRPEVVRLHDTVVDRRLKNNFGPSLTLALERKSAGLG